MWILKQSLELRFNLKCQNRFPLKAYDFLNILYDYSALLGFFDIIDSSTKMEKGNNHIRL